ncbi:MAG TPA: hypothetical protein P5279_08720 [Anaerohalosphaeraceae bacterium]|jgi:hypothetical protein|nr:hypothetical protein [Anaerohalosphaeraceae bacterium]HRT50561.1 hypothetical protein [Anaerohalosphaeraceae bacterium]HRT86499.1 hypothetical protein [Anaerohalosphaeraceae bacterium]
MGVIIPDPEAPSNRAAQNSRPPSLRKLMQQCRLVICAFVGIQVSWAFRPFVGSRHSPTQVFGEGAWRNACVNLAEIIAAQR